MDDEKDYKEKIVDGIEYKVTTYSGKEIEGWVRCPFVDRIFKFPRFLMLCIFVPLVCLHVLFSKFWD